MSRKVEKQCIPVVLDEQGEPIAIIFYNKHRDRVIFTTKSADEDEIIDLIECKDTPQNNES